MLQIDCNESVDCFIDMAFALAIPVKTQVRGKANSKKSSPEGERGKAQVEFESLACVKWPKFEFFQWLDRLEIISWSAHGGEQNQKILAL